MLIGFGKGFDTTFISWIFFYETLYYFEIWTIFKNLLQWHQIMTYQELKINYTKTRFVWILSKKFRRDVLHHTRWKLN